MHAGLSLLLRQKRSEWHSLGELSRAVRLSEPKLLEELRELRRRGFQIAESPRRGIRLVKEPPSLISEEISWRLGTSRIGTVILCLDEVSSTNDVVWQTFRQGAQEGLTVFAEEQTKGRGRFGRRWLCPRGGGILVSCLLVPPFRSDRLPLLTVTAALATCQAIEEAAGHQPAIRWPNDIVIDGKKVAGVLVESQSRARSVVTAVVGIGLNVNVRPQDFPPNLEQPATSLLEASGKPVERLALARSLLRKIDTLYGELLAGESEALVEEWRRLSVLSHRRIRISLDKREAVGRVLEVDPIEGILLGLDLGGSKWFRGELVRHLEVLD